MTKTEIEKAIQRKKNEYNALLEEYGSGVRPSWVSSDLAHIGIDIQGYKLQLKELEVDF